MTDIVVRTIRINFRISYRPLGQFLSMNAGRFSNLYRVRLIGWATTQQHDRCLPFVLAKAIHLNPSICREKTEEQQQQFDGGGSNFIRPFSFSRTPLDCMHKILFGYRLARILLLLFSLVLTHTLDDRLLLLLPLGLEYPAVFRLHSDLTWLSIFWNVNTH